MRGVKDSLAPHGTQGRLKRGCRCDLCVIETARDRKRRRVEELAGISRKAPAIGTARRLQALAAIGWSGGDIAARLGCDRTWVSDLRRLRSAVIWRATAEKIAALYDELSGSLGPSQAHTRRRAVRLGWAPPLAWDDIDDPAATPNLGASTNTGIDTVAVDRAIAGDAITLTHTERVEAIRIAAARGHSDAEIAQRLRVNVRTVLRIRTEHNILSRWNEAA